MAATNFTPIQLYRTSTAAAVPTAGNLADGEIAINLTDEKLYFKNAAGTVKLLASNSGALGSVTSVAGTGTVSGITLTGTVTSSGSLTLGGTLAVTASNFASQTANTILAAPNGVAGVPTFRALVAADVPTLNQNTTGTSANVTGTVAIANGGTGGTTQAAARTGLGATTVGANVFTLTNPSAITFPRFNADNTVSALDAADFRTAIGAGAGTGTVTSVDGTGTVNGITLTGTVTSSGSLTLGGTLTGVNLASQVTGTLPVANGGTGATTAGAALTALGAAASGANTDITALDQDVTVTATGTIAANTLGYRGLPQNSQSAAYTLVLADAGKHIFHPVGDNNARTFTIPANSSVAFPVGTAITFINMAVANVTIAITTDTLTLSPAGTSGSRTLATNGSATCIKITSTQWLISGSGLT